MCDVIVNQHGYSHLQYIERNTTFLAGISVYVKVVVVAVFVVIVVVVAIVVLVKFAVSFKTTW